VIVSADWVMMNLIWRSTLKITGDGLVRQHGPRVDLASPQQPLLIGAWLSPWVSLR